MAHVTGRRVYLIEAELDQGVHAELLLQLIQVLLPRAVARQLDDLPAAVHLPACLEGLPHIRPRRQPGLETHHIWLGALHACLLHAEPMARTLIFIPAPLRLKPSPHGIPHMVPLLAAMSAHGWGPGHARCSSPRGSYASTSIYGLLSTLVPCRESIYHECPQRGSCARKAQGTRPLHGILASREPSYIKWISPVNSPLDESEVLLAHVRVSLPGTGSAQTRGTQIL